MTITYKRSWTGTAALFIGMALTASYTPVFIIVGRPLIGAGVALIIEDVIILKYRSRSKNSKEVSA